MMDAILVLIFLVFGIAVSTIWIFLIRKFWRLCQDMGQMNRTVQLMAHDLKDLRDRLPAGRAE